MHILKALASSHMSQHKRSKNVVDILAFYYFETVVNLKGLKNEFLLRTI